MLAFALSCYDIKSSKNNLMKRLCCDRTSTTEYIFFMNHTRFFERWQSHYPPASSKKKLSPKKVPYYVK